MENDVYVMPITPGEPVPAGGRPALSGGDFIIRDGPDYWVPVAMVKFDAATSDAAALADIRGRFEAAVDAGAIAIAVRSSTASPPMASDQSTH